MAKQKIKAIVRKFLTVNNPDEIKESVQGMYDLTMMSDHEFSPEERQQFTYDCREMINFLNELSTINKRMCKKIFKKSNQKTSRTL